jgi:hypothetical protein
LIVDQVRFREPKLSTPGLLVAPEPGGPGLAIPGSSE